MMTECPQKAYEKIVGNPILYGKIISNFEKWKDILIYSNFDGGTAGGILDKAEKSIHGTQISYGLREIYSDILKLEEVISQDEFSFMNKERILLNYPTLLAYAVLGKKILKPEQYGFTSRRTLEEAITSFCFGEEWNFGYSYQSRYVWRNKHFKHEFNNAPHGDFYLSQIDVSGKYVQIPTLFGIEEKFDTWKDVSECSKALHSFQNWRDFTMIVLRYAEAIGKGRIPEIVEWRELEKTLDGSTPATAEAMFGSTDYDYLDLYAKLPIYIEGKELTFLPLEVVSGTSDQARSYIAHIKNGKLLFMKEDEHGLPLFRKGVMGDKKYSVYMEFDETYLVDLLKGVYKLYSRDKRELPILIDLFLNNPHT
jgi:hypothetical protein